MAAKTDSVDLGRLGLSPGEARRLDLEVRPGALQFGGERYSPPSEWIPARLEVTRTAVGHALRLRIRTPIDGACVRCLEPAEMEVEVDAREIHQFPSDAEELRSPYVDEADQLDLGAWAHDALALAMPERFLCRPDCAGLCPVCGVSLNDAKDDEHVHEAEPDPRWSKLRQLKLD